MCKKVHNACICGFLFVSLRSLTLRFVMSRDLVASGKLALRYALPTRRTNVSVPWGPQIKK